MGLRSHCALQWHHNERDGISNHQPRDCLHHRLLRRRSKKISKLRVTGLCEGNSLGTGEFPAQRASDARNASIRWRHHGQPKDLPSSRSYDALDERIRRPLRWFLWVRLWELRQVHTNARRSGCLEFRRQAYPKTLGWPQTWVPQTRTCILSFTDLYKRWLLGGDWISHKTKISQSFEGAKSLARVFQLL